MLYGVQAGLRSADRWVPGSRRYTDPATLLLPPQQWAGQRDDCTVTGTDANPQRQLERLDAQLHAAVGALEAVRGLTKWCRDLSWYHFCETRWCRRATAKRGGEGTRRALTPCLPALGR